MKALLMLMLLTATDDGGVRSALSMRSGDRVYFNSHISRTLMLQTGEPEPVGGWRITCVNGNEPRQAPTDGGFFVTCRK